MRISGLQIRWHPYTGDRSRTTLHNRVNLNNNFHSYKTQLQLHFKMTESCDHYSRMYFLAPCTGLFHEIAKFLPGIERTRCIKGITYNNLCFDCYIKQKGDATCKERHFHYTVCNTMPPETCMKCRRQNFVDLPIYKCEDCFFTFVEYIVGIRQQTSTSIQN